MGNPIVTTYSLDGFTPPVDMDYIVFIDTFSPYRLPFSISSLPDYANVAGSVWTFLDIDTDAIGRNIQFQNGQFELSYQDNDGFLGFDKIGLAETGVTSGSYDFASVDVDRFGRITSATSGRVIPSSVAAGTYSNPSITVDANGSITALSSGVGGGSIPAIARETGIIDLPDANTETTIDFTTSLIDTSGTGLTYASGVFTNSTSGNVVLYISVDATNGNSSGIGELLMGITYTRDGLSDVKRNLIDIPSALGQEAAISASRMIILGAGQTFNIWYERNPNHANYDVEIIRIQ